MQRASVLLNIDNMSLSFSLLGLPLPRLFFLPASGFAAGACCRDYGETEERNGAQEQRERGGQIESRGGGKGVKDIDRGGETEGERGTDIWCGRASRTVRSREQLEGGWIILAVK